MSVFMTINQHIYLPEKASFTLGWSIGVHHMNRCLPFRVHLCMELYVIAIPSRQLCARLSERGDNDQVFDTDEIPFI